MIFRNLRCLACICRDRVLRFQIPAPSEGLRRKSLCTTAALTWVLASTVMALSPATAQSLDEATPVERLTVAEGFHVERLYSVPADQQGSWVSMCVAPEGRLIVCDQYGGLFYVDVPPVGKSEGVRVTPIRVDIGEAQGLLWAFDSLYVVVNRGGKYESGLYRVTDTDGDGELDHVEQLRKLQGGGEHGPHAVLLHPDGKHLVVVCGDNTKLTQFAASRVPRNWDEDLLLPRPYGRGFMRGTPAPGGYVSKVSPDGKTWELMTVGFRNPYDAAFHADGSLFTYDADMEWDMNTPWYRPTRICLVASGADFGWRNGGGKWPPYYPDTLPAVVDIGPGSPTGVVFGYGTKFPAKYQKALFICDWSYGKLYAVHFKPHGSTYAATFEEFIAGAPLPLTDIVVHPDGALYFAIGGRRVQSGLYRVTYKGNESTEPVDARETVGIESRRLRRRLESLHVGDHPETVTQAWPHLGSADRYIRHAARIAIEHRPRKEWQERALSEKRVQARLTALLALARSFERPDRKTSGPDLDTPVPDWNAPPKAASDERAAVRDQILHALSELDWEALASDQRVHLLRDYELTFLRVAPPTRKQRDALSALFESRLPSGHYHVDSELAQLLVYLQSARAAELIVPLLESAPTQEAQIDFAKTLRHLRVGWNEDLRRRYFEWFRRAATFRGGAAFQLFVEFIKQDAVRTLTPEEKQKLGDLLKAPPVATTLPAVTKPRPHVKDWTMEDLLPAIQEGLHGRNFENGKKMFSAALCFNCHRFADEGGAIGPELTGVGSRFSPKDILESIIHPSKTVSDQYAAISILTTDGRVVVGRIANLSGDRLMINMNMLEPGALTTVKRSDIEEMRLSRTSMMPEDLLNTLHKDEILDLLAYLISGGDPDHQVFQQ